MHLFGALWSEGGAWRNQFWTLNVSPDLIWLERCLARVSQAKAMQHSGTPQNPGGGNFEKLSQCRMWGRHRDTIPISRLQPELKTYLGSETKQNILEVEVCISEQIQIKIQLHLFSIQQLYENFPPVATITIVKVIIITEKRDGRVKLVPTPAETHSSKSSRSSHRRISRLGDLIKCLLITTLYIRLFFLRDPLTRNLFLKYDIFYIMEVGLAHFVRMGIKTTQTWTLLCHISVCCCYSRSPLLQETS